MNNIDCTVGGIWFNMIMMTYIASDQNIMEQKQEMEYR